MVLLNLARLDVQAERSRVKEQVQTEHWDGGQDDIYTGADDWVSVISFPIILILIVNQKSNA